MKVRNKIISAVCALSMAFSMVGAFAVNAGAAGTPKLSVEVTKQPTASDRVVQLTATYSNIDTTIENLAGVGTFQFGIKGLPEVKKGVEGYDADGFYVDNLIKDNRGNPIGSVSSAVESDGSLRIGYMTPTKVKKEEVSVMIEFNLAADPTKDVTLEPVGETYSNTAGGNIMYERISTDLDDGNGGFVSGTEYITGTNLTVDYSKAIINKTATGPSVDEITLSMPTAPSGVVDKGTVTGIVAEVKTTGDVQDKSVTWTLTGNTDAGTSIATTSANTADLTVSATEGARELTVKATSAADPSVSQTMTVKINQPKELTMTVAKATGTGSFNAFNVNVKLSAGSTLAKPFDVIVQGYDANGAPVGYAIYKGISNANIPAEGYNFTAMLGGATEVKAWAVIDADYAAEYLGTVVANPVSTNSDITK
jgi:hypothetical protein